MNDDRDEVRDILRGYMSPANEGINRYAQRGEIWNGDAEYTDGVIAEIDKERLLAMKEHADIIEANPELARNAVDLGVGSSNQRVAELSAMLVELAKARAFLIGSEGALDKSIGTDSDPRNSL